MQVAHAIGALGTLHAVLGVPDQEFRRSRLADLLAHPDFGGIKAELGRALGYLNGAFVRQMLDGERPISEKTVRQVEAMRNGKFKGWFTGEATQYSAHALRVAELFDKLPPGKRRIAYAMMQSMHNPEGGDVIVDLLDPPLALPTPQRDKAR